jgi:Ca2+-binding EF-hand superfamily protein
MIVDRALEESDMDKDGKISSAELASMEDRRKQMLEGADANGDGFMDRAEMTTAATAAMARIRQQMEAAGGGGGPPAGGGQ